MSHRWDFSEIHESARLCAELLAPATGSKRPAVPSGVADKPKTLQRLASLTRAPTVLVPTPAVTGTRQDRLQATLTSMCQRGGFSGAVVADAAGLSLAAVSPPIAEDALAAFTSLLGEAIVHAGRLFVGEQANNLSLDISYVDKLCVRRFLFGDVAYYLLVICPQERDERAEIELSVDELQRILAA